MLARLLRGQFALITEEESMEGILSGTMEFKRISISKFTALEMFSAIAIIVTKLCCDELSLARISVIRGSPHWLSFQGDWSRVWSFVP